MIRRWLSYILCGSAAHMPAPTRSEYLADCYDRDWERDRYEERR